MERTLDCDKRAVSVEGVHVPGNVLTQDARLAAHTAVHRESRARQQLMFRELVDLDADAAVAAGFQTMRTCPQVLF